MHYQLTTTQSIFFQRQTSSRLPVFSTLYNWKFREEEGWFFSFSLMIISPILHKSQAKWKKNRWKGILLVLNFKVPFLAQLTHFCLLSDVFRNISLFLWKMCYENYLQKNPVTLVPHFLLWWSFLQHFS